MSLAVSPKDIAPISNVKGKVGIRERKAGKDDNNFRHQIRKTLSNIYKYAKLPTQKRHC